MKPIGTRFGMLVISRIIDATLKNGLVECRCDCGNTIIIPYRQLANKIKNSCGCCSYEQAIKKARSKTKKIDLTGKVFGRLTVIKEVQSNKNKRYWLCKCSCGNNTVVEQGNLINSTRSCGCLRKEKTIKTNKQNSHIKGLSNTRLYTTWSNMKERCYNSNNKNYKYYGKLGIKICPEWLNNFLAFYEWAINNGYSENLTIDRINPFKDYEPSNCRWATRKEQANNTRKKYKK